MKHTMTAIALAVAALPTFAATSAVETVGAFDLYRSTKKVTSFPDYASCKAGALADAQNVKNPKTVSYYCKTQTKLAVKFTADDTNHHGGVEVDISGLTFWPGFDKPMISTGGEIPPLRAPGDFAEGAFRMFLKPAFVSFDDPVVYPAQSGVAHCHVFFGNTKVDAFTTADNIRTLPGARSTGRGGTVNLSAYWTPCMIDENGKVVLPNSLGVYYKDGWAPYLVPSMPIVLPDGLKFVSGNAAATTAQESHVAFNCFQPGAPSSRGGSKTMPQNCQPGDDMVMDVSARQCWDGRLDSPNHKDHLVDPEQYYAGEDPNRPGNGLFPWRCPSTHNKGLIPITSFQFHFTATANTGKWKLASDMYKVDAQNPGGASAHIDYMEGWDPEFKRAFVNNCLGGLGLNVRRDCGSATFGDGRGTDSVWPDGP